jgi:hypothetical protein
MVVDPFKLALHLREQLLELCVQSTTLDDWERRKESVVQLCKGIEQITSQRQDEFERAVVQG